MLGTRLCLPEEKIIRGEMPERERLLQRSSGPEAESEGLLRGGGPGDPDLITVKGKRLLEEADLVIFAGSLVNPALLEGLKAEKMDSNGAISGGYLSPGSSIPCGRERRWCGCTAVTRLSTAPSWSR